MSKAGSRACCCPASSTTGRLSPAAALLSSLRHFWEAGAGELPRVHSRPSPASITLGYPSCLAAVIGNCRGVISTVTSL